MKDKITEYIVQQLNSYKEEGIVNPETEITPEVILYGRNGLLNSLHLVRLIVDLEEHVQNEYNKTVTVADEKVFSIKHSPFRSAAALADYTTQLMNS